ncbi:protein kinase domain-containing protein, partial [Klebsiella pneumoniae]|uniref:protein kinase domain-containing protein n=1 Tax=Klebsiella pneumoniae TaxID=573 RepID=UPI003A80277B
VRAYEMGLSESGPIPAGTPYLVLEHVRGGPAHHALSGNRGDSPAVERLAVQMLSALTHVHAAGYVHRDLKPENLFYEDGYVKIGDYGLSKYVSVSRQSGQTMS